MTIVAREDNNLDARIRYAMALAKSNLLPKEYRDKPENVLIAIEYGYALGIPPIQALNQVFIVEGKPSASADLIAALVRRAGHKLRVTEGTDANGGPSVTASLIRSDDPDFAFTAVWDLAKARAAGLGGKDVWRKYPGQMLRARAITEVCRQGASDALYGVIYTPEELGRDGEPPTSVSQVEVESSPRISQTTSLDDALAAAEAFDAPVDAEIVVEVHEVPIRPDQLAQLVTLMGMLELGKDDMLTEARSVSGRDLAHANDLTALEGDRLIEYLTALPLPDRKAE